MPAPTDDRVLRTLRRLRVSLWTGPTGSSRETSYPAVSVAACHLPE